MKNFMWGFVAGALIGWCAQADAADLSVKARPNAPEVYADAFSGFYIGGHFGYGWMPGDVTTATEIPMALKTAPQGFIGGGHLGYGQRVSSFWYLGLEADADVATLDGTLNNPGFIGAVNSKNRWLASIRGRVGIIPVGHAMLYATGGYGWASSEFNATVTGIGSASTSATVGGGVFGGGIEVPFSPNWLGRVEYLHYALSDLHMPDVSIKTNVDVVRGGLSYKF